MLSVLRPEMAELGIPSRLDLHALPNPFRDGTTFRLRLPFGGKGFLRLYDVLGRPVRTLRGTWHPGEIFLSWDGRDEGGRKVASGVYVARLEVGGEVRTTKVLLVR
ncbi:MAG TPA: T9SS type A sorting domain-containing protein [Candidatus Latescibacteria bacterium]|nr:T9SS type A sorting domain-containing protein [Candidatus Latescibacterota bacterium]